MLEQRLGPVVLLHLSHNVAGIATSFTLYLVRRPIKKDEHLEGICERT